MPKAAYCAICQQNQLKCLIGGVEVHGTVTKIGLCMQCIDMLSAKIHNESRPLSLTRLEDESSPDEAWQTATWDSD